MPFNLNLFLETSKKKEALEELDFIFLCDYVVELLLEEATVITLSSPVTVVGDIHGQFYDLLKLFEVGGQVPQTKYIFMGDYVDRGYYSLETLTLLLSLKARYPERIFLLRGNHETRQISQSYGFFDDCMKRYGNILPWTRCMEVFDCLPIAGIIDENVLCVHGGLSPDIRTLDQIRLIPRRLEVPISGAYADLMWSDPDQSVDTWMKSPRGAGWYFGEVVAKEFNRINKLSLVCRAHQLVMDGYKNAFAEKNVVTVWSAPNYCYRCGNVAAVLQLNENMSEHYILFSEVPDSQRRTPERMPVAYFM